MKLVHYVNSEASAMRRYYDDLWWEGAKQVLVKVDETSAVTRLRCLTLPPTHHKWVDKGVYK